MGIALVSACEDILTEQPRTFLNEGIIFSDEAGLLAANYGVYESLRDGNYYGQVFLAMITQTEDTSFGRGSQKQNQDVDFR